MRLNYLLLLPILQGSIATECPCEGVVIPGSDQDHCWEVVSLETGGWVGGDIACQRIGGHLGHLNTDIEKLTPYLAQVYSRPILTGIIAGNLETDRFGLVCPNNKYYGLMSETETSQLLSQTNGSTSTCVFLTNGNFKVLLAPCTTVADALCDRPVEKPDYCDMKINCSLTTTKRTTTRTSTTLTTTKASAATTTTSASRTTTTANGSTATTTTNAFTATPTTTKTSTTTPTITNASTATITVKTSTTADTSKVPTGSTTRITSTQSTATVTQNPAPNNTDTASSSTKITTKTPTATPTTSATTGVFTNETTKATSPTVALTSTTLTTKVTGFPSSPTTSPSTTPSVAPSPIIPPPTQCKNETCTIKIFFICLNEFWSWLLLGLLLLALLLLLCCCVCLFRKRSRERQPELAVVHPPKQNDIEAMNPVIRYSPEPPQPTLPPQPTESTPVVVFPIPFQMTPPPPRREVVEKFTREIHVIEKEKAVFKDVGTNTDPWIPTLEVVPRKPKEVTPVPLDHDDIADEISIDIPRSPSPDRDTIAPVGDVPVLFSRNAKPNQFDGIRPPLSPEEHEAFVNTPEKDPATVISLTADPRNIRSPPLRQKNVHLPTQEVPSFSPISDISDDVDVEGERKPKPRFPSPPKNKPKFPVDEQTPQGEDDYDNKGPGSRAPSRGKSGGKRPRSGKSPSDPNGPRQPDDDFNPSYGRRSAQPSSGGAIPLMKPPDVSIRAARGRLGGVVRAGGGPDDNAPQGWKPWAKTAKNFQPSSYND